MAVTVTPLTAMVLGSVRESQAGLASGINNAIARVAGLLGIAIIGIFVVTVFNAELDQRVETLGLPAAALLAVDAERIKLAGAQIPPDLGSELGDRLRLAIAESFVNGFRTAALASAGMALASGAASAVLIESRRPRARMEEG